MPDKLIKPKKTPEYDTIHSEARALGCVDIETPQGLTHCHDAEGFMTAMVETDDAPPRVGLFVFVPGLAGRPGYGLTAQLDANGARSLATSLVRLADKVDGGAGKQ